MLRSAKWRASTHALPFNLTIEDISIPKRCPVFGTLLGTGKHEDKPSLDRVIPRLGYVRGNVIVVSVRANRLKADATLAEMEKLVAFYQRLRLEKNAPH